MRELNNQELSIVSGGTEIVCTFGFFQFTCTGSLSAWNNLSLAFADSTFSLYDAAVESTTELFDWMFGDSPEEAP